MIKRLLARKNLLEQRDPVMNRNIVNKITRKLYRLGWQP